MGLRQFKPGSLFGHGQGWLLPVLLAGLCLLGLMFGDAARELLRYERAALAAGEVHRLLSGHFVHLGIGHAVLNLVGLGLVWMLVGGAFSPLAWVAVLVVVITCIDAGFWFLLPSLNWYVGLSGVLHGLLVAGLIRGFRARRVESLLIGAGLAAKLIYELWIGPLPGSADAAGGAVIVEAHLFGAVGGLLSGILWALRNRTRAHD